MTRSRSMRRRGAALISIGAIAVLAMGCSSSASKPKATAVKTAADSAIDLKAAGCPSTVVIQTDWNPESEHGGQYQLLGPNPTINTQKKSVSGDLYAEGKPTGVKVEIRSGGPAIGFQTVTSQMYKDKSITLGYLGTDEQVSLSAVNPTVAVLAGLQKSPQIIQWSPQEHPDFKTIADIGKTNTKVLYFEGASYMDYLIGKGILKKSQVDGNYDGTPTEFVGSKGKFAVQGFATSEPYTYSHEVKAWDKPMKYQLIADAGFDFYQQALGVRKDALPSLTKCLTKLVPIMQQAIVDFVEKPAATNALILKLVGAYNNGWVYTPGVAAYAVATEKKLGIVANDPATGYLGSFDASRVQELINILKPIYSKTGKKLATDLTPSSITTNQFLDKNVKLP
ncbi:ABC transporter substrate-binding protein [uncultured Jatrophihabitans sp.]|uniref:ABC transporter substrate-binding protein n=1 Tax=uncultured Jatrophihabitans sp. TaxID=1610747 RepID=UPI0035CAB323